MLIPRRSRRPRSCAHTDARGCCTVRHGRQSPRACKGASRKLTLRVQGTFHHGWRRRNAREARRSDDGQGFRVPPPTPWAGSLAGSLATRSTGRHRRTACACAGRSIWSPKPLPARLFPARARANRRRNRKESCPCPILIPSPVLSLAHFGRRRSRCAGAGLALPPFGKKGRDRGLWSFAEAERCAERMRAMPVGNVFQNGSRTAEWE